MWTSRAPASYKERVPRVILDDEGRSRWVVDGDVDFGPMGFTVVKKDGEKAYGMISLTDFDEMSDAASYPEPRLDLLDRLGISQQIIYPNVAGFGSNRFMSLEDSELRNICARVYNDAIIDLQQAGNGRLFPQALTPFWDIDECVREIRRVTDAGDHGYHDDGHAGGVRAAAPARPALGPAVVDLPGAGHPRELPRGLGEQPREPDDLGRLRAPAVPRDDQRFAVHGAVQDDHEPDLQRGCWTATRT